MIRFLRSIRQSLLAKGRITRYLAYAIGEIVLVVIGIVIALQLNNWNNEQQLKQVEIKYLKEIANNLQADSVDIQFNIDFNEVRRRAAEMVLKSLEEHEAYSDTMDQYFGNLLYTTRSVMNYSAYETLKSRGLEIISNDSLRMMITQLYSFSYHNVIDFEKQDDHALQYAVVIPAVIDRMVIDPSVDKRMALSSGRPKDFSALKTDDLFKNAVLMNLDLRVYMLSNYRGLAEKVAACRERIRIELEHQEN
ncbi:MAG: DUF6090 family protein [Flavobacteriales bacterium]